MSNDQAYTFRRVTAEDFLLIYRWFKEPYIAIWWPIPEHDEFFENFLKRIRSDNTFAYLCLLNDTPIAYIQYYYVERTHGKNGAWFPPELPATTVGTDQFIGIPDYIGKGHGTLLVKAFIDYLVQALEPTITTVVVDPDPENGAAIRCYEKVGFKRMGIYAAPWGNALLMRYDIKT